MSGTARGILVVALGLLLAACSNERTNTHQGWIEGVFVFVGPDEAGRVEQMHVREGDPIKADAPLFSVDAELQQADLRVAEAALANSQNAFERAQQLLKSGSGSQQGSHGNALARPSRRA